MKTAQQFKDEATRLNGQLLNHNVIDLSALRQLHKDLDDYLHATPSTKVADFDQAIKEANAAKLRLSGQLVDLINLL